MHYYLTLLDLCGKGILVGMGVGSVLTCAAGAGLYKLYNDHCAPIHNFDEDGVRLHGDTYEDA